MEDIWKIYGRGSRFPFVEYKVEEYIGNGIFVYRCQIEKGIGRKW